MTPATLRRLIVGVGLSLLVGCAHQQSHVVYQNSTIDALLDGNYDGDVKFAEVRKHGNFGLGTFNALNGEMIAIDGTFYQVRSDGHVSAVSDEMKTPLAIVTTFHADATQSLNGPASYPQLQQELDSLRPSDGHAFAFVITGDFAAVKTRSVPQQSRPYPRLAEVVKTQPVFNLKNVHGTLVGFWFPESMRHVNVPGYHFHFLTADHTAGGHVLDLQLTTGSAEMQELNSIEIALPAQAPTMQAISRESGELEKVEK